MTNCSLIKTIWKPWSMRASNVTGRQFAGPLVEHCQHRCGTVSSTMSSASAVSAGETGTVMAASGGELTELSDLESPSIMFAALVGMYATGCAEVAMTTAMGGAEDVEGSPTDERTAATFSFLTCCLIE
jgi:hypothetical protein